MPRRNKGPSRREFTEKIEKSKESMDNKEGELKIYASDLEQERRTLEGLDLQGAQEDAREVEEAISRAEDVTAERFGGENERLEHIQEENQKIEGDFHERRESAESDLGKINEIRLESREAVNAMVRAKEAAIKGKEFLNEQIENTRKAREASETAQRELEARVNAVRGGTS